MHSGLPTVHFNVMRLTTPTSVPGQTCSFLRARRRRNGKGFFTKPTVEVVERDVGLWVGYAFPEVEPTGREVRDI